MAVSLKFHIISKKLEFVLILHWEQEFSNLLKNEKKKKDLSS